MYLANQTRPDIAFAVNLLGRYSVAPTICHWNGVKHIFCYLRGHSDLGLFFLYHVDNRLIGYADVGYLLDTNAAKSQTDFVFTIGGTAFSWKASSRR